VDWGQALPFGVPDDINVTGTADRQSGPPDDPSPAASGAAGPVDLNTASLAQLNALRGAGGLGRAIIRGRPYASPEDLARKRVVRRPIYERIKDQVAVR
jgi:DNA uptake protein ComE-like DNA-binding protein